MAERALPSHKASEIERLTDELNDVGCECSRLESDILEIHDALEDIGLKGMIHAESIVERVESVGVEVEELRRLLANATDPQNAGDRDEACEAGWAYLLATVPEVDDV